MNKTIIAMGGGYLGEHKDTFVTEQPENQSDYFPVETTPIDRLILESTGKNKPKVLIITTASEDGLHDVDLYVSAFKKQYEGLGASVSILEMIYKPESLSEIKAKINEADAVYVSGGDTTLLVKTWLESGVSTLLRDAYQSGTVMSGLSAGACCWFESLIRSPQNAEPYRQQALGWIDALLCVHYNTETDRQEPFKQALKENPKTVGIALDQHTAIEIVNDSEYRIHLYREGSKARKCYWKDGEYFVEEIASKADYASVVELLSV